MRITAINHSNIYTQNYSQTNKNHKTYKPAFGSVSPYILLGNSRFQNLIEKGYRIINNDIKLISPNGTKIDGAALIKDGLRTGKNDVDLLITDGDCFALGEIYGKQSIIGDNKTNILNVLIRNYTELKSNDKSAFLKPFVEARYADTDGIYRNVGKNLYSNLINYIRKYYPQQEYLLANVGSKHSWDFHKACGFKADIKGKTTDIIKNQDKLFFYPQNLFYKL